MRTAHANRKQVFSPALADKDAIAVQVAREWQQIRLRERFDWLYAYDATALGFESRRHYVAFATKNLRDRRVAI